MPYPNPFSVQTATIAVPSANAELVALTLNGVSVRGPGSVVHLVAMLQITPGTSTTAIVVRLRRGTSVSGTLVGAAVTQLVTVANGYAIPIEADDTPGEVANQSYVLTIQQTGGAASGTGGPGYIIALAE